MKKYEKLPKMRLNTFLILIFLTLSVNSQNLYKPKKIKVKKDYTHKFTKTIFPIMLEKYYRKNIYAFDKKKKNISATYENENVQFSVYIYPAGNGTDGRLRNEYLRSLFAISQHVNKKFEYNQMPIKYIGKYIENGYKAEFKNDKDLYSQFSIYECGTWFLKFRITSKTIDSLDINNIEEIITKQFNPSYLTEIKTLNPTSTSRFGNLAFKDSTMLGSNLGSSHGKFGWVMENIKANERASGFPDLYLGANIEQIKEFIAYDERYHKSKSKETEKYLKELKKVANSDFLNEFIMEENNRVMIIPDTIKLDYEGFKKWKKKNNFNIGLTEFHYVISFDEN